MLRWNDIQEQTLFGMTVKMYREPFRESKTFVSPLQNLELDHLAFLFLESELFMYKILDVNFNNYIEERGDLNRLSSALIPLQENLDGATF